MASKESDYNYKMSKILDLLRKIPICADQNPEELEKVYNKYAKRLLGKNRINKIIAPTNRKGARQINGYLTKFLKLSEQLLDNLNNIEKSDSFYLFDIYLEERGDFDKFDIDLIINKLSKLREIIKDTELIPLPRQRDDESYSDAITAICMEAYEKISGFRATVSDKPLKPERPIDGYFVQLVEGVFPLLEAEAKAPSTARRMVNKRKKARKKPEADATPLAPLRRSRTKKSE